MLSTISSPFPFTVKRLLICFSSHYEFEMQSSVTDGLHKLYTEPEKKRQYKYVYSFSNVLETEKVW